MEGQDRNTALGGLASAFTVFTNNALISYSVDGTLNITTAPRELPEPPDFPPDDFEGGDGGSRDRVPRRSPPLPGQPGIALPVPIDFEFEEAKA